MPTPHDESPTATDRRCGVVRRFDPDRGYGFIWPGKPTPLVFVHFRDVEGHEYLRQGEPVTFEIVERDDRPGQFRAVHVRRILAEPM
jgi:cold shock CspA family protein